MTLRHLRLLYIITVGWVTCQTIETTSHTISISNDQYEDSLYQSMDIDNGDISTALRIQRDIAMNITIDQCLWPSINIPTSFYGNDESTDIVTHTNTLLNMGYKRLIIDLYWNYATMEWYLCPIASNAHRADAVSSNDTCNPTMQLHHFMYSVNKYLISTEVEKDSSRSDIVTVIMNLHQGVNLLGNTTTASLRSLSDIIVDSISPTNQYNSRIYTPFNLTNDRLDTSSSFYAHGQKPYFPHSDNTEVWPTLLYLMDHRVQLLVGLGTVDRDLTYSLTEEDRNLVFGVNTIMSFSNNTVSLTDNGKHCMENNNSWAFVKDEYLPDSTSILNAIKCGYSPLFTHTHKQQNTMAANIVSTLWSWDINEPRSDDSGVRCAIIQSDNGRWMTNDCLEELPVACRKTDDPNAWMVTEEIYSYDRALTKACPAEYIFDTPRIASQNEMLHKYILSENRLLTEKKIWVNLNLAHSKESCWVIGAYKSCWWTSANSIEYSGLIKTSIVAGVIILILVGIFIWVKCTREWRKRNFKSRKARIKAMIARNEYTTVPA